MNNDEWGGPGPIPEFQVTAEQEAEWARIAAMPDDERIAYMTAKTKERHQRELDDNKPEVSYLRWRQWKDASGNAKVVLKVTKPGLIALEDLESMIVVMKRLSDKDQLDNVVDLPR